MCKILFLCSMRQKCAQQRFLNSLTPSKRKLLFYHYLIIEINFPLVLLRNTLVSNKVATIFNIFKIIAIYSLSIGTHKCKILSQNKKKIRFKPVFWRSWRSLSWLECVSVFIFPLIVFTRYLPNSYETDAFNLL